MKNLHLLYIVFVLLSTAACSETASDQPAMDGDIRLGATVGDIQADSRATAKPFQNKDGETWKAAVWFRKDNGVYEHNPDATTNLPVHTTVDFTGSDMAYVLYDNQRLKYPTDDALIHCVGLYPATGWVEADDKRYVTHPINGEDDLMFASEIQGSWNAHFPTQNYNHLLTWIKINICASSHAAVDTWGEIKQITIKSDSKVKVDLMTGSCSYENGVEGQISLDAISPSADIITLTTANKEVGSVFCSPELAYDLIVESVDKNGVTKKTTVGPLQLNRIQVDENNNEIFTPIVNEEDLAEARGVCFVFSLYFKPDKVIEGVTTLNSWSDQNEDIYF